MKDRLISLTIILALAAGCGPREGGDDEATTDNEPELTFTLPRLPRWASRDANVRAGAGTGNEVVARLARGERIEVGDLESGWFEVYRDEELIGWVSETVLSGTPLPQRQFRIRSVRFQVAARNESSWRYSWALQLENTGLEELAGLDGELKFVDANSYLVATDTVFGMSLEPGQMRTYRGELSVPLPRGASIRTVGAEIQVPVDD